MPRASSSFVSSLQAPRERICIVSAKTVKRPRWDGNSYRNYVAKFTKTCLTTCGRRRRPHLLAEREVALAKTLNWLFPCRTPIYMVQYNSGEDLSPRPNL